MTVTRRGAIVGVIGVLALFAVCLSLVNSCNTEKSAAKKEEAGKTNDVTTVTPTNLLPEVTVSGTEIRIVAPRLVENNGLQTNSSVDTALLQETVKNAVASLKPGSGPVKITIIAPELINNGTGSPSQVVVVDMGGFRPLVDRDSRYTLERPILRTNDLSWSHQVIWADLSDKVMR